MKVNMETMPKQLLFNRGTVQGYVEFPSRQSWGHREIASSPSRILMLCSALPALCPGGLCTICRKLFCNCLIFLGTWDPSLLSGESVRGRVTLS